MTSLPYNIQEADFKKSTEARPYLHNNFSEVDYDEDVNEVVLKIDSNDRNIDKYKDPFSFRVRFNQTESNFDSYGNAGPIVLSKYSNIKYIKLVEAIIPRNNIVQEYVNYNKTLYDNSKIHCYSLLKVQDSVPNQKQLKLKLNSGDQIKINATNYTVERHITYNNVDYLQLKGEFYTGAASQLYYQNVKLIGTVSGTKGQTTINGVNTEFSKLFANYKIKVNNQELIIQNITNDLELIVTTLLTESFSNAEIYVIYDANSKAKDTAGADVNGANGSTINKINYQQNTNISDDTVTQTNDIILFDYPNGTQSADKISTNASMTTSFLEVASNLEYPIDDQKFLVLPKANFDKIPGNIHFDKTNKKITGLNVNFTLYNIGSIIYLDIGVANQYVILKITQIVSESEIKINIIKDADTGNTLHDKTTGTDQGDIKVQEIYNYSYVRSEEEFSDERFILTNIKEFSNDTYQGTNENSSKAFGILFPAGTTKGHAYMSGISHKLYNRRNLQNLNSLTISFNDSYGNQLKLNNLDPTVDREDIRHPLNKDNQVHLTFRIGLVENRFD